MLAPSTRFVMALNKLHVGKYLDKEITNNKNNKKDEKLKSKIKYTAATIK